MNPLILESPLLDKILRTHSHMLSDDYKKYQGHCYRILNYCLVLQKHQSNLEQLSVIIGFHDLGIWTHKTMDYLHPSYQLAQEFVRQNDLDISWVELETSIKNHHKITSDNLGVAEVLRKADLADLSYGLIRSGIPKGFIKSVRKKWSYQGFQKMIFGKVAWHAIGHPWNPFPMMKW